MSGYVIDLLPEGGCLLSEVFNTPMLRVVLRMLKLPTWPHVEMCSLCMRGKMTIYVKMGELMMKMKLQIMLWPSL